MLSAQPKRSVTEKDEKSIIIFVFLEENTLL